MADDGEELDWGGEEDENYDGSFRAGNTGDIDDTVSIGGEEDDMQELAAFHSRTQQGNSGDDEQPDAPSRPHSVAAEKRTPQRDIGGTSAQDRGSPPSSKSDSNKSPLKHALPPKPVSVGPPPSFRGRAKANPSPMRGTDREPPNRRRDHDRDLKGEDRDIGTDRDRANGSGKPPVASHQHGLLPPDWEVRRPRDPSKADNVYYFNTRTEESRWERPLWPDEHYNGKARSLSPQSRGLHPRDISPLGTEVSESEARPSRYGDSQSFRNRVPEPALAVSQDDRHYRPPVASSRRISRSPPHRRTADRSPTYTQAQHTRDNLFVDAPNNLAHRDRGRTPPRSYTQPSAPIRHRSPGHRRDAVPPAFDEPINSNRSNPRGREFGSIPQGAGSDRGWATKREQAHARPGINEDSRQNFEDVNVHPRDDRRRQPYSGEATHQRRMSRSPPPLLSRERGSYRGKGTPPPATRESFAVRDVPPPRGHIEKVSREENPKEPWNITIRDRRGPKIPSTDSPPIFRRPPDFDSRTKEHTWSPPRGLPEDNLVKRRRVDEQTADSSQSRRARSRSHSPTDRLRNSYSSSARGDGPATHNRAYSYRQDRREREPNHTFDNGFKDDVNYDRNSRDVPDAPRWPARDRDRNAEFGSNSDVNLPSGPRIRNQTSFNEANDRHGAPPITRQPSMKSASYSQPLPRHDLERVSDVKARDQPLGRDKDSMDIDIPAGPKRDRRNEPAYGRSGMYNDRYLNDSSREKEDSLPTGPRAMSGRSTIPPSPVDPGPSSKYRYPNGSTTTGSNDAYEPRSVPPRNPRRSRFDHPGAYQTEDLSNTSYASDDAAYSKARAFGPPPPASRQSDVAIRPSAPGLPTAPTSRFEPVALESQILSDANTIPVRSGKSWTVTSEPSVSRSHEKEDANRSLKGEYDGERSDREFDRHKRSTAPDDSFSGLSGDMQRRMSFKSSTPPTLARQLVSEPIDLLYGSRRTEPRTIRRTGPRNSRFGDPTPEVTATDNVEAPRTWTPRGGVPDGRLELKNNYTAGPPISSSDSVLGGASISAGDSLPSGQLIIQNTPAREKSVSKEQSRPESVKVDAPQAAREAQHDGVFAGERELVRSQSFKGYPTHLNDEVRVKQDAKADPFSQKRNADNLEHGSGDRRSQISHSFEGSTKSLTGPSIPSAHPIDTEGSESRPPSIVRIRRPSSKFDLSTPPETNFAANNIEPNRVPPPGADDDGRGRPHRGNSLLDRLSMNVDSSTDSYNRGMPPLLKRVAPHRDIGDDDAGDGRFSSESFNRSLDDNNASFGSIDDIGHSRRYQGRGRARGNYGGRGRRRGRG